MTSSENLYFAWCLLRLGYKHRLSRVRQIRWRNALPIEVRRKNSRDGARLHKARRNEYRKAARAMRGELERHNVRIRYRERYNTDEDYRLTLVLRARMRHALSGHKKQSAGIALLGCDLPELKSWLSGWFEPGMTWENYGTIWHIDHHRPCASFNLADSEQQKQCFHYLNLRPLFAEENLRKGKHVPC